MNGSGLMEDEMTNMTNVTFNCLASDTLSSFNITNRTHWEITEELQGAAPVLATIYAIFFALAFFWNLFIVITYLAKYKLLKEPGNLFLFNLALADLLVAVTVMIFSSVAQAGGEFIFGYTDIVRCNVCDLAGFCTMFFVFMSFHLLAALSIDRFIQLTYPLRYKRLMSLWRAVIVISISWIVSFIIGILPFLGFGQYEFNRQFGSCIPRFTGTNLKSSVNNFFYVIFAALEALIPIIIIGITNVFTYRLVSKFLKKNLKRKKTFRNDAELKTNSAEDKKHKQQQNQLVKVFGALCIANCVSWTPVIAVIFSIGVVGLTVASSIPDGVYVFGWFCYLTNPVVHPIIESFFVKDLRYQVTRAKKSIRRASTAIIKSTTKLRFRDTDLDRANQAIDSGATKTSKRTIRFFNTDKAKAKREAALDTTTMNTEDVLVDEMTSQQSTTPSPVLKREIKKMEKVGRSVTFTDNTSVSPDREGGVQLKSVLKRFSEPAVMRLEEVGEIIREENDKFEENQSNLPVEITLPPATSNGLNNGIHIREENDEFEENELNSPVEITLPPTTSNGLNNGNGIHIRDETTEIEQEDVHVNIDDAEQAVTGDTHIDIDGNDDDELASSNHSNKAETQV